MLEVKDGTIFTKEALTKVFEMTKRLDTVYGISFDSSTGFRLPNGAIRSPDAAWIKTQRWQALTQNQRRSFAPLCPDFVIELRSSSDQLSTSK